MPDDRLKRKLFGQKVGVEELMEIISLWNLRPAAMKRLEKIIRKDFRKTPTFSGITCLPGSRTR